ncbi:Thiol-disulfide isomerase or thioredoxin [Thalassolituus maritimus]|uniref:Thiol-disulfide isomerase or thioredoxin n=1 Tax=Thalassolituus maritimus TaxID=484498 RepID=A0A1N7KN85_9GAMM|nr:TlpA disulfide reductase family protein [Thalassolituus maritimus]SIS63072.1 Thiol-disulfide isomerase or thioredoxin [Thalassolituus maritimus]
MQVATRFVSLIKVFTRLLVILLLTGSTWVHAESQINAPVFTLSTLDEKRQVSLEDYRGKVIYLDFWASWCGPCRKSLPMLNELRNELKDRGFEVLALNVDETREEGLRFLKEYPVDYPTLFDNENTAATYQLRGMPTAYLIDHNGKLHSQHVGFNPKDMSSIRDEVLSLLKAAESTR